MSITPHSNSRLFEKCSLFDMEHTNKMRGKKRYTAITVFLYMLVCQRETLAFYSECVHEGLRVDCSYRNLTSMPKDTQHMNLENLFLDLRGNFIDSSRPLFSLKESNLVTQLDLSRNNISQIDAEFLKGLQNLVILILEDNN